ncbi:Pkinase-domain-containing protein [Pisolithus croceorrhizus]|nr:Pkinase-domain-containing protein [Pisolithus croceorrhizus]
MVAVALPDTSKSQIFDPLHMASLQRSNDKLTANSTTTTSSRLQSSGTLDASESATQPSSATTFRRLRSSFGQGFRTATRSRTKVPTTVDDEFGTITIERKAKDRACHDETSSNDQSKDKGTSNMLKRLETKVGIRFAGRDSTTVSSIPIAPVGDQRKDNREHVDNADRAGTRVAGWRSFMTPTLQQASASSPALHLSSQVPSSTTSRPAVMPSSSSPSARSFSPSRDRPRRVSVQPTPQEIGAPQPLAPRRSLRNNSRSPERGNAVSPLPRVNRHRPSPISPSGPRSSLDTQSRTRDLPTPPDSPSPFPGQRGAVGKWTRQLTSASTSQVSLSSQPTSPGRTYTSSPTYARTPIKRIVTPTSVHGFTSPSSSNLPSDSSGLPRSPTPPPRRPSAEIPRRGSIDTQRRPTASPTPRTASPTGTARSRATSPSQRSAVYGHGRNLNMSSVSLTSHSTPEQRELIRLAMSVLCKELRKPPPHLSRADRQREWAEVEVRMQPLIRMERVWGESGRIAGASASQITFTGLSSASVVSNAGEERERKLFCEALRDGVILCQLMNKHRPNTIPRVDLREDGFKRATNITKFLAACSSQGVPSDDLFYRDDLVEATPEALCRVARAIVALLKLFETPTIDESKVITGQKKLNSTATVADGGPHSPLPPQSNAVALTPNSLPQQSVSLVASHAGPGSRSEPPPESYLHSFRPDSPHSGTSSGTARHIPLESRHPPSATKTGNNQSRDLAPGGQPLPPPKPYLRTQYHSKRDDDSGSSMLSTIKPLEFPRREPVSQCSSPTTGDAGGDVPIRQSRTSSNITENTAYSSIFDLRRNSNAQNKFGTVRTVTTEATSLGSEVPSFTRTEASSVAASLAEEMGRRRSTSTESTRISDRRPSEPVIPDLVSLTEEEENSACGSSSRDTHRDKPGELQANKDVVRLGKGKWPDDFLDAFRSAAPPQPVPTRATVDVADSSPPCSTPLSVSPGRKLSIIAPPKPIDESDAMPRRPSHRARHSVDTPILMPKESILRIDGAPESPSASGSRIVLRRQSTRTAALRRNVPPYGSRMNHDDIEREGSSSVVPFPRAVSGDHSISASPTPGTPTKRDRSTSQDVSRVSSRFQSDLEDLRSGRRSRPTSYDELGRSRRSSELLTRDSMDGSGIRQAITVTDEGKQPVQYQLGNCIGRGQFGTVYRALNMCTGQMVAVKRIRLEGLKEDEVTQLMEEVDLMKSLSHPSIVKYEGMVRDNNTLNIVLEYAESGSLGQTLKAFGNLNEHLVASYVVKILEGLHYLHKCHVVHCDLKAANILTTKTGNVKLSDFGVSLNLKAVQREMNNVAGTPNWMAPEVIELKGASTKSDIWSLGCTVIELLTGRPPYGDITNSMTVMFRIVEDDMPPLPENCSDALQDFLQQCFNKDPELRPDAETLCEHPWLTSSWDALKELRPQDSIPFLRRVSVDLQKTDAAKLLAQISSRIVETPVPEILAQEESPKPPSKRHPSLGPISPLPEDTSFNPRDHSFAKTTFGKPMVCRVCLGSVKKIGVICDQCNLIAHSSCSQEAPPTCDFRSQLLQYAHYAEMNAPSPVANVTGNTSGAPVAMPPPRPSANPSSAPLGPGPPVPTKAAAATGLKFAGGFGQSHSSLSVAPPSSPPPVLVPYGQPEEKMPRRISSKLPRNVASYDRPHSLSSNSTTTKSLKTAESRSSRQGRKTSGSVAQPGASTSSQVSSAADRGISRNLPAAIPQESEPQKKRGDKSSSCTIQ